MNKFKVAYRIRDVDHMDVTLYYATAEEALEQVNNIRQFKDLVKLVFEEVVEVSIPGKQVGSIGGLDTPS